jgi:O-antigen ligase
MTLSSQRNIEKIPFILALAIPLLLIIGRGAADVGMGIVSLWFVCSKIKQRDTTWLAVPWIKMVLVTFVLMCVSASMADFDRVRAFTSAFAWLRFPLFAVAFATWIYPHPLTQRYLSPSLMILCAAVMIDTVVQFITGTSLTGFPKPDYAQRLTGPFGDDLIVGVYLTRLAWPLLGMVFGAVFFQSAGIKKRKELLIALALTAAFALVILISGERVAFALFGLCAMLFLCGAQYLRGVLGALGACGAILVMVVLLVSPKLYDRVIVESMGYLNNLGDSSYGAVWGNGIVAWQSAPIFGIGLNNFVPMCETLGEASGFTKASKSNPLFTCARHPHNIYLEWLASLGLVGFGCFILLIILWVKHAWQQVRRRDLSLTTYYQRLGLLIALVPFLWPLMSSMSFFSNWSAVLFWWVMGWILSDAKTTRELNHVA